MNRVILHDAQHRQWLEFSEPVRVVCCHRLEEVVPALQAIDQAVSERAPNTDSPLWAAGFVSYEAASAFDPALTTHPPDTTFPLLWFGLYNAPRPITPPLTEAQVIQPPMHQDSATQAPPTSGLLLPKAWRASITRDEFNQAIEEIKTRIVGGETYQVNYTHRLSSTLQGNPLDWFWHLVRIARADYAAYVECGERHIVCSASPELFFHYNDGKLTTRPMKGTAPRGRTQAEDVQRASALAACPKNRAENLMIVDMMRNDLSRLDRISRVDVDHLFAIEKYPTLWQMTSTIATQTGTRLPEWFAALFPCASITGAPKAQTMRIIQKLEPQPRRLYTGSIGFVAPTPSATPSQRATAPSSSQRTTAPDSSRPASAPCPSQQTAPYRAQFNVAIRTALIDRVTGAVEYGVGGGIVADSHRDDEFHECATKARLLSETPETSSFALLETLLWRPHHGYDLLAEHTHRVTASARYFDIPFDPPSWVATLHQPTALWHEAMRVRATVDREGRIEMTWRSISLLRNTTPLRLALAPSPVSADESRLFHKTTDRTLYDAARAACPQADDTVLWNHRGEITETTIANLVVLKNGKLVTPAANCGLLPGTLRARLLERGILHEARLTVADLLQTERIFTINSVQRWRTAILAYQRGTDYRQEINDR